MDQPVINPVLCSSVPNRWSRSATFDVRVLVRAIMLILACGAGTAKAAEAGEQEATITVGGETLALQAKGTRSRLFGSVDVYSVGVYASREVNSVEALRDPQLTRAVRLKILYDGGMPAKIPSEWWQELVPVLDARQQQKLREAFGRMSVGDDVWISYAPSKGTLLRAGGSTVLTDSGDGLMNAVLDLWFGATPVSSDLHEGLVNDLRGSGR